MKYKKTFKGTREEFHDFVTQTLGDVFSDALIVRDQSILIPDDTNVECDVQYNYKKKETMLSIKAVWSHPEEKKQDKDTAAEGEDVT